MNGFDAWRRLVRYIEHGRPTRPENISRGMEAAHQKPIRDMTKVVIGIADFEHTYHKYIGAGGKPIDDYDLEQNLTNIISTELQNELVFRVNLLETYSLFSQMVRSTSRSLLQLQHKLPMHMVNSGEGQEEVTDNTLA